MFERVIRNGNLADGTGAPLRRADVGIRGAHIAAVAEPGSLEGRETIDASGLLVTPGFVDPHTHYDGQVTWDPVLAPSSWHGVTTIVMGNCGVGFAPARPDKHQWLIELMEGVEDIPGSALAEGIRWGWESFADYLDVVASQPRILDVCAQVPHGAVRAYVMGERGAANQPATTADIEAMAACVRDGMSAGALAFSTNRLPLHTSIHGEPVPGTFAPAEELLACVQALGAAGTGLFQTVPAGSMGEDPDAPLREVALYERISRETGRPVTFSCPEIHANPGLWRRVLDAVAEANTRGARIVPQVQGRPAGLLASWATFNPFMERPSYQALAALPLDERVARLREPKTRAAILAETKYDGAAYSIMKHSLHSAFAMDDGPVFEPEMDRSILAIAEREGRTTDEVLYDTLCELAEQAPPGQTRMLHVYFSGYGQGNFDNLLEMIEDPNTVVGLSDGGAHCSMICDASLPTFMLAHFARDRTRGPKLSIERVVETLSREPAALYELHDRGVVREGARADLNVIDFENLRLELPEIVHDLPTGAARVVQDARGFIATLCGGEVTLRGGKPTEARPGQLVRGPQPAAA